MKKHILLYTLILLIFSVFSSCKKSVIDDNFYNPEKAVTADVPRLYAGIFAHEKVMPRYWNLYTFHIPVLGTYSQTSGYTNGKGVYEQPTNYTGTRWDYFFTHDIAIYRELEKYYNKLQSDAEKEGYKLFLETARIFLYDQATQIVDLFGDIPFTKSGGLNAEGKIILPSYDKQSELYGSALTELKRISDYLATISPSSFYGNQLKAYDYVNGGDLIKWRKYCNSLILRLAMRTSFKDENASKTLIQTILGNPSTYPIINTSSESAVIQANSLTSSLLPSDKNEVRNGFGVNPFAPGKMVNDIMLPSNDLV
ncbi:MAG: SusD/RagB family nutrient-binding outer membrane lipoprotein [Sphingobacteriales bacterium]|nr:SusD/RagB family nutrient-binding outer membrane lipoprotein [Sphingobacteriales bacterium]